MATNQLPIKKSSIEATSSNINTDQVRADFPILERIVNGQKLVYLDSAATTQKPRTVIDAISEYYLEHNANVHRGIHTLAEEATTLHENTRKNIAQFIGGVKTTEIIYTRNTTEAINLVAYTWARKNIKSGDRIVITQMEHHANLVPWIILAKETGAQLEYIPITTDGYLDLSNVNDIISQNTKLVSLTHMSNVLGTINPVEEIIELAHKRGALALIDGAQSVPHMPVNVLDMDADFLAFSAHKMLGPTGIGVLYAKEELLEQIDPFLYGGEMINLVKWDKADWSELPYKFEAGTPDIAGSAGFGPALDYLTKLGMANIRQHELELTAYALERMNEIDDLILYGPTNPNDRGGAIAFTDPCVHPHDLSQFLDTQGVAVRAGHHCAQPLTRLLGVSSTTRASFYVYNDKDDIDKLIDALKSARRYFGNG